MTQQAIYAFTGIPQRITQWCIVMTMKPRELLRFLLERSGDNPNSLSGKVGVPQSTIQRFLAGTAKQPRHDTLAPIARFYGIPVVALMNEKDSEAAYAKISGDSNDGTTEHAGFTLLDKHTDIVTISRYETGGSMGDGVVLHDQPGIIESWKVSKQWLAENVRGYTSAANLAIVTGFGDSMRPTYNPGDPLIVDRGITTVPYDSIYFFRIGEEGFVKRLQRVPTENGLIYQAISDNPAYPSFPITPGMDFAVLGRVVQVWRREDY